MATDSATKCSVYLTDSERRALQLRANKKHCSTSYVMRMLIRTYLSEELESVLAASQIEVSGGR